MRLSKVSLAILIGCGATPIPPPEAPRSAIATSAAPAKAPAPIEARYDWVGVIGTGQSLAVGAGGRPLLSLTQPFHNLKQGPDQTLLPLVEPIWPIAIKGDWQYPNNILGETPHSAMANQLTTMALARGEPDYVTLHSAVGWSGHCMSDIDKSGSGLAYPSSLSEARAFKQIADAEGKTFAYGAVLLTHGECDAKSERYAEDLHALWRDYDADLRSITGQAQGVVLLESQQNTSPTSGVSASTLAQWSAGVSFPGKIVCVGPKYQYAYAADGLHLDAAGYRRLGEKYAEVFDQVFRQKKAWQPLQPTSATRRGLVITVSFHVPNPPLAWDETLAPPHQGAFTEWANGRGFEVLTDKVPLRIAAVDIHGDDVLVTLRSPPEDGASVTVGYAMIQDAHRYAGGDVLGRRGQLADSDPLVGWDAEALSCHVEHGSNLVTRSGDATFAARTLRDVVGADGLAERTIVTEKFSDDALALSSPWQGATGEASLAFHHDQRNYAVAFRMPVQ